MALFSNTLKQIREYLSVAVGDYIGGTADSGSATTLVHDELLKADDYYNNHGYFCYISDGTNEGEESAVSDWTLTTPAHTLTLDPGYTAAIDSTSVYELHYKFREHEYRKAINLGIEYAGRIPYLLPLKDITTIRLTSAEGNDGETIYTWEYTLPTSMLYLHQVITEDWEMGSKITGTISGTFTNGETMTGGTSEATGIFRYQSATSGSGYILVREVDGTFEEDETVTGGTSEETVSSVTAVASEQVGKYRWLTGGEIDIRDWDILRQGSATPKLRLDKEQYTIYEDLYLQLEGQGVQAKVTDDDDSIYLPPDWLVQKAITYLPMEKLHNHKLLDTYKNAQEYCRLYEPHSYPHPQAKRVFG